MMPARPPPMARGVGQRHFQRVAGRVLRDRDEAGDAAAALVFAAHGVAGALRRDHEHVDVGARVEQVEMHVQAVREGQRGAGLQVRAELLAVQVALALVRGQHHDDVGPFGGIGRVHDLQPGAFRLGDAGGAGPQPDGKLLDAAVLQVQRMGVALAAVADDGDVLPLDQVHVGIAIVVDAHSIGPFTM